MTRHLGKGVLVFTLLGVVGCATLLSIIGIDPERPKATLKSIEVSSVSFEKIELVVTLSVENKNSFALNVEAMDYHVSIAKVEAASGLVSTNVSVPANGSADVPLPVTVRTQVLKDVLARIFKKHEDLKAQFDGTLTLGTPLGRWDVSLKDEKVLSLPSPF